MGSARRHHSSPIAAAAVTMLATAVGVVGLAAAPAGAATSLSGTKVAKVIQQKWWPTAKTELAASVPDVESESLTQVKCPKSVPAKVKDPESSIYSSLEKIAAGGVHTQVTKSGVFGCTAVLADQPILIIGAVSPKGDARFATGSLVLVNSRLAAAAASEYASKYSRNGTAVCDGDAIVIVQPGDPIACEITDSASGKVVNVDLTADGSANVTFEFQT